MSKAVRIEELPAHNYIRKLKRMMRAGVLKSEPGTLYDVIVKHEDSCAFLRGGRCDCNPEITQQPQGTQPE